MHKKIRRLALTTFHSTKSRQRMKFSLNLSINRQLKLILRLELDGKSFLVHSNKTQGVEGCGIGVVQRNCEEAIRRDEKFNKIK